MKKNLFNSTTIKTRIIIACFVFAFLSISCLSFLVYFQVKKTFFRNIEEELRTVNLTIRQMLKASMSTSVRNYLRAIADKNVDVVQHYYTLFKQGVISEEDAKKTLAGIFLSQKIGDTGYVFVWDIKNAPNSIPLVVHPVIQGKDVASVDFVQKAAEIKTGYIEYEWKNPGEVGLRKKSMYFSYFEPWDWVVTASSYKDEFKQLFNVEDFKENILSLTFRKTGYSFVVDGSGKAIAHKFYSGKNILGLEDFHGDKFIKEICDRKQGSLFYYSNEHPDPIFKKRMAFFEYVSELDWIVVSSRCVQEFYNALNVLLKSIFATIGIVLLVLIPFCALIATSITAPLKKLTKMLYFAAEGDLSVRLDIPSFDEIGQLAEYFNYFMIKIEKANDSSRKSLEEKEKFQTEIEKLRNYLKNIIDSVDFGIVGIDKNSQIVILNKKAELMSDRTSVEASGEMLVNLFPVCQDFLLDIKKSLECATSLEKSFKVSVEGEVEQHWTLTLYPLVDHGYHGGVILLNDVTEKRRFEEVVIQSEKMLSIGGLAAGVAHEINNPLAGMLQNLQVIRRRFSKDVAKNKEVAQACDISIEKINEYIERRGIAVMFDAIVNSGKRATKIVHNVLSFSRKGVGSHRLCDLRDLVNQVVELSEREYNYKNRFDFRKVEIIKEYQSDVPDVLCDSGQIQQVVLNLLKNAAQAIFDEREEQLFSAVKGKHIVIRVGSKGDSVFVEVEDNGPGMSEDIRKRVFEPFFTTKKVGIGTGLGMSVSYFIITEAHNGTMDVYPVKGGGTKFVFTLPINRV